MKRLITLLSVIAVKASAQCVMCFRTAAAQQAGRARILNVGILLLGIPPFLILAAFLYLAWRRGWQCRPCLVPASLFDCSDQQRPMFSKPSRSTSNAMCNMPTLNCAPRMFPALVSDLV